MVELNKTYVKKENKEVKVIPHGEKNGIILYHEVGYLNQRELPKQLFLERFELKVEE